MNVSISKEREWLKMNVDTSMDVSTDEERRVGYKKGGREKVSEEEGGLE
jgi:hypothetical protein